VFMVHSRFYWIWGDLKGGFPGGFNWLAE
jgi:hypothetical protein